jgi:hypothetical protein
MGPPGGLPESKVGTFTQTLLEEDQAPGWRDQHDE